MANNKATTLRPPQSPNPQPAAERMPVKAAIYRTLAELNAGFESVALHLNNLLGIGYLPAQRLLPLYNLLGRIRAQATASSWP